MNNDDPTEVLYRHFSKEEYKISSSWVLPNVFTENKLLQYKKPEFVPNKLPPQYNKSSK